MNSDPFDIVKDSSIWFDPDSFTAANSRDPMLRLGIVKKTYNDAETTELRYLVEVQNHNDKIEITCKMLRRFGGVYNYEDYIGHGYNYNDKPDTVTAYEAKAGDVVLVGLLNGHGREGVIIGGMTHAARSTSIQASDGPQYKSEFNGLETFINKDGEFTVTFKGQPTNLLHLNDAPSKKIAAPQYNSGIGSSYYKFDKTGSWTLSDNATSNPQLIKIDKPGGTIQISAGKISLKMTKASEAVSLTCKTTEINSTDQVSIKTREFLVDSSSRSYIKSPKIAIGKEGIELLDQLAKLVDAIAKVQPISPVGPCTPLKTAPNWSGVEEVKAKIKEITGSF